MANYSKQMAVASTAAISVLIAGAGAQNQDAELVNDTADMADIEPAGIEPADAAFNEVDDPIWPPTASCATGATTSPAPRLLRSSWKSLRMCCFRMAR